MAGLPAAAVAPLGKALGALVDPGKAPQPGACRLHAFPSVEQANVIVIELADPRGDLVEARREDREAGVASRRRARGPRLTSRT